jgi:PAS domain S-box-containing protein
MGERIEVEIQDLPDAAVVVDPVGTIVAANGPAERLFGYDSGELIGSEIETLIPERFRSRHVGLRQQYTENPRPLPTGTGRELWGVKKDGGEFPVEIALGPIGATGRVLALIRDLTKSFETREDLRKSEQRFRVAAESMSDLIWEGNTQTGTLLWHGDINSMLGYEPGEFPHTIDAWLEHVHPDDRPTATALVEHVTNTGEFYTIEYRIRRKDGSYLHWIDRGKMTLIVDGKGIVGIGAISDVTEHVLADRRLEDALVEIGQLKDRLQAESEYLQSEIKIDHDFEEIIGNSAAMLKTLRKVEMVANTDSSVLLQGETGTGKELLARAIHARSRRKGRPLIKVDCSTLPAGLIESELFGHEKGAFTGAHETRIGRFALAHEGTIFLDEIGELPADLQSKLLRVLEDGVLQRVGSSEDTHVDVRLIAATNRDLKEEIKKGTFRSDLFYRLSVFPIETPPLRSRREDIPLLVSYFTTNVSTTLGKTIHSISKESMEVLEAYEWPGNVRELRNVIERSAILSGGDVLEVQEVLGNVSVTASSSKSGLNQDMDDVERARIVRALEESDWKIKGDGNAASRLGLSPSTLRSRMKRLEITRP